MFGYVNVKKDSLTKQQYGLWHTFLCGLCMSLKDMYGNTSRLTANFDINFFNLLFHSVADVPAQIVMARCVASPFKKRSILKRDSVTDKLATANVLLIRLKAADDVADEPSLKKRAVLNALKKSYRKAAQDAPELDKELKRHYADLYAAEKRNCDNIDQVCHYSALITQNIAEYALGNDCDNLVKSLCYNVGKWIYLIDALDDLKRDVKRKNYNPFVAWLKNYKNRKQFVADNAQEIEFVIYSTLNRIAADFNDLNLNAYACVLKNIIYESLRQTTERIMYDKESKK